MKNLYTKTRRRKTYRLNKESIPGQLEFDFANIDKEIPPFIYRPFRELKDLPNLTGWRPTEPEQT